MKRNVNFVKEKRGNKGEREDKTGHLIILKKKER